jgi:hypothetical protein
MRGAALAAALAVLSAGCDKPATNVVLDNDYPASAPNALVVYRAWWLATSFQNPIPPGASSDTFPTAAASPNTAYVVLAPGWDPTSATAPTSLVVMQSRTGFELHFDDTLHIKVDDTTFVGNCAAGSVLSQDEADFITQRIFPGVFGSVAYDAATCKTTPIVDASDS